MLNINQGDLTSRTIWMKILSLQLFKSHLKIKTIWIKIQIFSMFSVKRFLFLPLPWRLLLSIGLHLDSSAMRWHMRWTPGGRSRRDSWRGTWRCFRRCVLCCRARTHRWVFPRDAFEEVTDPALLLLLRVGQQKQLFCSGHVIVHCWGKIFPTN